MCSALLGSLPPIHIYMYVALYIMHVLMHALTLCRVGETSSNNGGGGGIKGTFQRLQRKILR
jgi:hypothetical protein